MWSFMSCQYVRPSVRPSIIEMEFYAITQAGLEFNYVAQAGLELIAALLLVS